MWVTLFIGRFPSKGVDECLGQVFGPLLEGPLPHPMVLAAHLLQPALKKRARVPISGGGCPTTAIHVTLLNLVRLTN
jgi:hypothetical protein